MNSEIFYPMLAVMGLTMVVGLVMWASRIHAVSKGVVSPRYFALLKGSAVPEHLEKLSNNFNNLFALPTLFYVLCLTLYVLGKVDLAAIIVAWIFFVSRVIHTAIHISYNHVLHRMLAFIFGFLMLIIIFIRLLLQL